MDTHGQEQVGFDEKGFALDVPLILANKEMVTDFFGDNRESWYRALFRGGSTYKRTSLALRDENIDMDGNNPDENDLPPLDPGLITEGRARDIAFFFKENAAAARAFQEYYEFNKKTKRAE